MSPVTASRHYQGPGLGETSWRCPACGVENVSPIGTACQSCGAGQVGRHGAPAPGQPPVNTPPPPQAPTQGQGDVADYWAEKNPEATVAEAYRAGYLAGVQAARAATKATVAALGGDKTQRTIAAALAYFRDQVLAGNPEEVETGEWLSAQEVDRLLAQ